MKKSNFKKVLGLVLCLSMVFALVSCGQSQKEEKKEKKELKKMSIVLDWYPNAIHTFIYNAINKGYYKDEGIDLKILFPANPNDGISMPAAGKADFGIYYTKPLIKARIDEDVPVKSIGALVQTPLNVVLSLKDKGITKPKDLEGKKVGYAGMDLSTITIKEMMKNAGADPSKVQFVDVGFDLMNALTTKQVDATTDNSLNHELPMLQKEGFKLNEMYPTKYGIPNYYGMVIIAGDKTLNDKKDLVEGFLRASKKGFEYAKNHKKESIEILLKNQNKENFPLDKEVETKSLDILLPRMETKKAKFLSQTDKVWENNIKWMKEVGFLKGNGTGAEFVYNPK